MQPDTTLRLRRAGGTWQAEGASHCRVGAPPSVHGGGQEPFAEWAWDGAQLSVRNDRYGLHPMFVTAGPDRLILSTSLEGALRAGAAGAPDDAALAVLIRLGFLVGDDTPFQSIRTLPPGAEVKLDGGTPRVTGAPLIVPRHRLVRDEALTAYVDLFRQSIARRPPEGPSAVPLSGGRDSRHIAFELSASGHPPDLLVTARHHPPKHDEDARVAALIAEALGLPHEILEPSEERVEAELRKNPATNFASPDMHAWYFTVRDHIAGRIGCMYDGFGGDLLSMARYLNPTDLALFRAGRLRDLAERMLGKEPWLLRSLTRDAARRWTREAATDRLIRELEVHTGAANPVRSFRFWNYGRRKIASAPCGIFTCLAVRMPYLDPDLFAMLAGLDPEVLMANGGHFHTDAIRLGYPELSHLPFETSGIPDVVDASYYRRFARHVGQHLLRSGLAAELESTALWLRLTRCLAGGAYSSTMAVLGPWAIYLTQLEAMAEAATRNGTNPRDQWGMRG